MTTYTVYDDNDGRVYGRGLTAAEAMHEILTYDGHKYEIRRSKLGNQKFWDLYCDRGHNKMRPVSISSFKNDFAEAEQEIAQEVISRGFHDHFDALPDEVYDAKIAEWAEIMAEDQ